MSRAPGSYKGLTCTQADLLSFIRFEQLEGRSPSFEEMANALNLASKSGVHRLLKGLEERGYITRLRDRARSIEAFEEPIALGQMLTRATVAQLIDALARKGVTITGVAA